MQLNIKFSREEFKRISNYKSQLRRAINSNKITFTPEVYKKTVKEKSKLKKLKKAYAERLKQKGNG